VWKYNQSNNELVPGIQSLNPNKTHSSFNVHHINNPGHSTTSNRMAINGNGYAMGGGMKSTSGENYNFKTSSHKENFQKSTDHKVYSQREK
jgi:hypothetical protein